MQINIDIFILYILGGVAAILFIFLGASQYSPLVTYFSIVCVVASMISLILQQRRSLLKYEWAKPSNLFFFALIIVYFQQILDLLLRYKDLSYFVNPNVLNACNLLSSCGVISFVVGYIKYKDKIHNKVKSVKQILPYSSFVIVFIQVISFALFLININVTSLLSGSDFGSGYTKTFNSSVYYELLFNASIMAGLIQIVKKYDGDARIGRFLAQFPTITLILITIYLLLRLPSGDRGPVIHTIFAIFYSYIFATRAKIKIIILFLLLFFGAYGVSLIGLARSYDLNRSFVDRLFEAKTHMQEEGRFESTSSFFSATQELSFSYLSYQVMVDAIVQDDKPYHYGAYQIIHILNAIPFAPSFLNRTMGIKDEDFSSSTYATKRYLGQQPGWGLGTNCIGEFFLDFGLLGVLLGMFFTGALFKVIDNSVYIKNKKDVSIGMTALALVYSSRFLSLARGAILQEFRLVFLVLVLLFINKIITQENKYYH